MKRILFTLMIFALLLPPGGGAQEKRVGSDGSKTNEPLVIAPEPQEEVDKRDFKALLKALPVRDKRDVEDRKALTEILMKFNPTDQYLYERLSIPRFFDLKGDKIVPDEFMAELTAEANKSALQEIDRLAAQYNFEVLNKWPGTFTIIHIHCAKEIARTLSEDLSIRYVEPVQKLPEARNWLVSPLPKQEPKKDQQVTKPEGDGAFNKDVRINGDWALDMIDSRFEVFDSYYNSTNNAPNGRTYVLDDGVIDVPNHFNGRLSWIPSSDYPYSNSAHGTIVGSVLASSIIGTAINHNITSVRIPTGGNNAPDMIARLESIRADAASKRPAYAQVNMSIGYTTLDFTDGVIPTSLNNKIVELLNADIPIICSTGQFCTKPGCPSLPPNHTSYWPQRVSGVIKVGMANSTRHRLNMPSSYSPNCTSIGQIQHINGSDIFAPGGISVPIMTPPNVCYQAGILTIDNTGAPYYAIGTSVAAPIVSGVLAMYGSLQTTYWPKVWQITDAMQSTATQGVMSALAVTDADRFVYSMVPGNYCRNSASYAEGVARDSLVTCFSAYTNAQNAIRIRSQQNNMAEPAGVITSATSLQTNFVMPSLNIDNGPVIVRSYQGSNVIGGYGFAYVDNVNPGVFTLDSNGQGYAVAQAYLTDKATGAQTVVNSTSGGINWDQSTHFLSLVVYGTGWRYQIPDINNGIRIYKNGSPFTTLNMEYIGQTPGVAGLDQMNSAAVPGFLDNQGECEIRIFVNGKEANRTKVRFN